MTRSNMITAIGTLDAAVLSVMTWAIPFGVRIVPVNVASVLVPPTSLMDCRSSKIEIEIFNL